MKKLFYFGIFLLLAFEFVKVYFIMPLPGSQKVNSLDLAYMLHTYRWIIRIICLGLIITGLNSSFKVQKKWIPSVTLVLAVVIFYLLNFRMAADSMFKEPEVLAFSDKNKNELPLNSLVLAVNQNSEAKAYPIRYIGYHHQVRDDIGDAPVMITYCTVCRTGRAFSPEVNGKPEDFRLVGMDHFNAMFEDASTGSWWRQVNGEAVAGPLKGTILPEITSMQVTLEKFFEMYPAGLVMQEDAAFTQKYDSLVKFEKGFSESELTGTDSSSWKDKSWVVGVLTGDMSRAYDWNLLEEKRIIHDKIGNVPLILILSSDSSSFMAFEIPADSLRFSLEGDTIISQVGMYDFSGQALNDSVPALKKIRAYQEFWHSWRTFHPNTTRYD